MPFTWTLSAARTRRRIPACADGKGRTGKLCGPIPVNITMLMGRESASGLCCWVGGSKSYLALAFRQVKVPLRCFARMPLCKPAVTELPVAVVGQSPGKPPPASVGQEL